MVSSIPKHRAAALALALTLSLSGLAGAQTIAVPPVAVDIDNFARVNDAYYRGAQPEGDDYAALASLGVKTVINLTSDDAQADEQLMVEKNGMRYVNIPMSTRRSPTAKELDQFLAIVNDEASQPVYVHCVGGKHRTGVMTAVYRMTRDGITGKAAFDEMKQFKYGPDFLHPEFKKFVQTYQVKPAAAVAAASQQQQQ
jgi:protein tyrosine/serine phosphatase